MAAAARAGGSGAASGPEPLSETLARRLLAQRVVLLHGPLDDLSVTRVSAELMTLDAEGDEPVTLRVDCGEAGLAPALTLMDVIELMGVPGAGAVPGAGGRRRDRRRGRLRPPRRHAEHPVLPVRAQAPSGKRTCVTWPSGPSCSRPSAVASASASAPPPAGRPPTSSEDLERGRFLSADEAVALRHPRRGVPARRRGAAACRDRGRRPSGVPPLQLMGRQPSGQAAERGRSGDQ